VFPFERRRDGSYIALAKIALKVFFFFFESPQGRVYVSVLLNPFYGILRVKKTACAPLKALTLLGILHVGQESLVGDSLTWIGMSRHDAPHDLQYIRHTHIHTHYGLITTSTI
jgi:hypothetical protein